MKNQSQFHALGWAASTTNNTTHHHHRRRQKHLNNIFGKLGVSSRTQALARARELELL